MNAYIYPFLIFPIAFYLNKIDFPQKEKNKLLINFCANDNYANYCIL